MGTNFSCDNVLVGTKKIVGEHLCQKEIIFVRMSTTGHRKPECKNVPSPTGHNGTLVTIQISHDWY